MPDQPAPVTSVGSVVADPNAVPILHKYALTLLMATPSHLRTIKDNDQLLQKFLEKDCEIDPLQIPNYKAAIQDFDKDQTLSQQLKDTGDLLLQVLGTFYPQPPCPKKADAASIMKGLK